MITACCVQRRVVEETYALVDGQHCWALSRWLDLFVRERVHLSQRQWLWRADFEAQQQVWK